MFEIHFFKTRTPACFYDLSIQTWFRCRTAPLKEKTHHHSSVSCRNRNCFSCISFCIQEHLLNNIHSSDSGLYKFHVFEPNKFQLQFRLWWEQEMETRQTWTAFKKLDEKVAADEPIRIKAKFQSESEWRLVMFSPSAGLKLASWHLFLHLAPNSDSFLIKCVSLLQNVLFNNDAVRHRPENNWIRFK